MTKIELSFQDCLDLVSAIKEAQGELCTDQSGNKFPEATAYDHRLQDLSLRIRNACINDVRDAS